MVRFISGFFIMKWVVGIAGLGIVAGIIIEAVYHPSTSLHRLLPVFVIWFIAGAINWAGLGTMATLSGIKKIRNRDAPTRDAVLQGMRYQTFWIAFWISLVALVINTLAPLGLLGSVPLWSVFIVFSLNALGNVGAIPLRTWLLRLRSESLVVD